VIGMDMISVSSTKRMEMIDITEKVKQFIDDHSINHGAVLLYVPHTTAAVTINEGADPSVKQDIITTLRKIIPENGDYHHAEGNSDAHVKASLLGASEYILVEKKKLLLGTWQHVFFFEGDGPRQRKVYVSVLNKE
jgi:secondary thiamine-phosphate synthase enzyme